MEAYFSDLCSELSPKTRTKCLAEFDKLTGKDMLWGILGGGLVLVFDLLSWRPSFIP